MDRKVNRVPVPPRPVRLNINAEVPTPFVLPYSWYVRQRLYWQLPKLLSVIVTADGKRDDTRYTAVAHEDPQFGLRISFNQTSALDRYAGYHLEALTKVSHTELHYILTKRGCPCAANCAATSGACAAACRAGGAAGTGAVAAAGAETPLVAALEAAAGAEKAMDADATGAAALGFVDGAGRPAEIAGPAAEGPAGIAAAGEAAAGGDAAAKPAVAARSSGGQSGTSASGHSTATAAGASSDSGAGGAIGPVAAGSPAGPGAADTAGRGESLAPGLRGRQRSRPADGSSPSSSDSGGSGSPSSSSTSSGTSSSSGEEGDEADAPPESVPNNPFRRQYCSCPCHVWRKYWPDPNDPRKHQDQEVEAERVSGSEDEEAGVGRKRRRGASREPPAAGRTQRRQRVATGLGGAGTDPMVGFGPEAAAAGMVELVPRRGVQHAPAALTARAGGRGRGAAAAGVLQGATHAVARGGRPPVAPGRAVHAAAGAAAAGRLPPGAAGMALAAAAAAAVGAAAAGRSRGARPPSPDVIIIDDDDDAPGEAVPPAAAPKASPAAQLFNARLEEARRRLGVTHFPNAGPSSTAPNAAAAAGAGLSSVRSPIRDRVVMPASLMRRSASGRAAAVVRVQIVRDNQPLEHEYSCPVVTCASDAGYVQVRVPDVAAGQLLLGWDRSPLDPDLLRLSVASPAFIHSLHPPPPAGAAPGAAARGALASGPGPGSGSGSAAAPSAGAAGLSPSPGAGAAGSPTPLRAAAARIMANATTRLRGTGSGMAHTTNAPRNPGPAAQAPAPTRTNAAPAAGVNARRPRPLPYLLRSAEAEITGDVLRDYLTHVRRMPNCMMLELDGVLLPEEYPIVVVDLDGAMATPASAQPLRNPQPGTAGNTEALLLLHGVPTSCRGLQITGWGMAQTHEPVLVLRVATPPPPQAAHGQQLSPAEQLQLYRERRAAAAAAVASGAPHERLQAVEAFAARHPHPAAPPHPEQQPQQPQQSPPPQPPLQRPQPQPEPDPRQQAPRNAALPAGPGGSQPQPLASGPGPQAPPPVPLLVVPSNRPPCRPAVDVRPLPSQAVRPRRGTLIQGDRLPLDPRIHEDHLHAAWGWRRLFVERDGYVDAPTAAWCAAVTDEVSDVPFADNLPPHCQGCYFLGWGLLPGGSLVLRVVSRPPAPSGSGAQPPAAGNGAAAAANATHAALLAAAGVGAELAKEREQLRRLRSEAGMRTPADEEEEAARGRPPKRARRMVDLDVAYRTAPALPTRLVAPVKGGGGRARSSTPVG
ncbi:hypothetical protein HYH03_006780 [Edaphochlamys debaryana]|uniref:Uncharacterized protein n=1 Tax=Edaphochlamys debaryana TaxID=47281 RepID=A0A836C153_9CHLO|nr:hypothetical protein HYH03_006780 [Edaphochlamys debaryana]|eukprot:KAG2495174.1 hypothetical protein HYH03_006780 [Edaphochlamys debaryana]